MPIETLITRLTIESNTMGSKMAGGKKKDGKLTLLRDGSHLGREKMAEKKMALSSTKYLAFLLIFLSISPRHVILSFPLRQ